MSSDALRVQFDDLRQQEESDVLGMWIFLASEGLFFAGLLLAYVLYRTAFPEAFATGSELLHTKAGFLNTAVLLTSSLTCALAERGAMAGRYRFARVLLASTMALGAAFLAVKGWEWWQEARHHHVPFLGERFEWPGAAEHNGRLFMNLYFVLTGVHAIHLLVGIGVLGAVLGLDRAHVPGPRRCLRVRMASLYWHFVDVMWVLLFPLLYLVRP